MDIIFFGGQSNMQGQSDKLISHEQSDGIFEYRYLSDSIIPLADPVGENITYGMTEGRAVTLNFTPEESVAWREETALGAACYGYTNLVPEFCRAYRAVTGTDTLAVHVAKGATLIKWWMQGGMLHDALIKKCRAAVEKVKKEDKNQIGHIYFVWFQGESDALASVTTEQYTADLCELKNQLKNELGIEKFGIIRVGRFANDERDDAIINAQEKACELDGDFVMLTREASRIFDIPQYMNSACYGHYSAEGLEYLGKESGTALGKV